MDLTRGKFELTTMRKRCILMANKSLLEILVLLGCFYTACQSHVQGPSSFWTAYRLKTGSIGCLQTSVTTYQYIKKVKQSRYRPGEDQRVPGS